MGYSNPSSQLSGESAPHCGGGSRFVLVCAIGVYRYVSWVNAAEVVAHKVCTIGRKVVEGQGDARGRQACRGILSEGGRAAFWFRNSLFKRFHNSCEIGLLDVGDGPPIPPSICPGSTPLAM